MKGRVIAIQVSVDNKYWLIAYAYDRKTGTRLVFGDITKYKYIKHVEISYKNFEFLKKCAWEENK